ncbi:MAG TPA: hypothetical protein VG826_06140 [Pirellulales bacterium]|nr:hypothetical protein [Pirellulales bacterium]
MARPQFTLKTMLVISFGIVLLLGLRVGWFQAQSNPVYLAVVCLSCAFLGAALVTICMPRDD